jgi:hypothetical protein
MNDLDLLLDLPVAAQLSAVLFVACATGLLLVLLTAPRQDCFFLRWTAAGRLLALMVAPAMLIVWPVVLYAWFLKSRGIGPEDLDYFDED